MKSQSDNLLIVARGILADVQAAYPGEPGVDRDFARLTRLVEERGLGVFTLDLPALDSKLTNGLKSSFLDSSGSKRYSKNYPVPRLFAGLYMKIFDNSLRLRVDADINAIAFLRQLCCLGKKIEVPCSVKRKFNAIKEYFDVERQLPKPTLQWRSDSLGLDGAGNRLHLRDRLAPDLPLFPTKGREVRTVLLLDRCQRIADAISEELGIFCPDCYISSREVEGKALGLSHGPGAVAERSGKHFDKYQFTSWSAKLNSVFPYDKYGKMPNDPSVQPKNHEVPARLIAVPKTAKGPRLIAAEPSEHMYAQKLTASWLEDRFNATYLKHFIDLRDQGLSGELAKKASLTGDLATIDLSSASDRLSLWVLERIFRRNPSMLKAIHSGRTRWLRDPLTGECVELKKFASQGTAVTFPVQTLVFLVLALAVSVNGSPTKANILKVKGQVRVFGDDIILPSAGYEGMVELLTTLHLKVNEEKSFSSGNFRESCGVDAFKGYDVTPTKPKTTIPDGPASCLAVLDTINNLFCKGYWNASEQLRNRQPPRIRKEYGVVGRDAGATGYRSFSLGTALARIAFEVEYPGILYSQKGSPVRSRLCLLRSKAVEGSNLQLAFELPGPLKDVLSLCGYRHRYDHGLQRAQVRLSSFQDGGRTKDPYDNGYSGLLDGQLRPNDPRVFVRRGVRGVPERPRLRKVTRWETIQNLF